MSFSPLPSGFGSGLKYSKAHELSGFETMSDKVLREMNERAKNLFTSDAPLLSSTPDKRANDRQNARKSHKRYSSIHKRQFSKMDSIQTHYAVHRDSQRNAIRAPDSTEAQRAPKARLQFSRQIVTQEEEDGQEPLFGKRTTAPQFAAAKRRKVGSGGSVVEVQAQANNQTQLSNGLHRDSQTVAADSKSTAEVPLISQPQVPTSQPQFPKQRSLSHKSSIPLLKDASGPPVIRQTLKSSASQRFNQERKNEQRISSSPSLKSLNERKHEQRITSSPSLKSIHVAATNSGEKKLQSSRIPSSTSMRSLSSLLQKPSMCSSISMRQLSDCDKNIKIHGDHEGSGEFSGKLKKSNSSLAPNRTPLLNISNDTRGSHTNPEVIKRMVGTLPQPPRAGSFLR